MNKLNYYSQEMIRFNLEQNMFVSQSTLIYIFSVCGHRITEEIVDLEKEKASSEIAGFWFVKHALSVIVGHPSYLACRYTDCEFH
jgi:hypothetical protein